MYPQGELDILEQRKLALLGHIRARRAECVVQAERVLRPLAWIDEALVRWKAISPFAKLAAIPLGYWLKTKLMPKTSGVVDGLFKWAPIAINLFKAFR